MDKTSGQESGTSDNLAELRARAEVEPIASFLRTKLLELSPGYARVAMKLIPEYLNFNGLIFGGIVMAVADQAFAYASNSVAFPSYASQFNIHLIEMGYSVVKPRGAFYIFPKSPLEDDIAFVRELQQWKVLTVPGCGFGTPGYFRISYCVDDRTLKGSLAGFQKAAPKFNLS